MIQPACSNIKSGMGWDSDSPWCSYYQCLLQVFHFILVHVCYFICHWWGGSSSYPHHCPQAGLKHLSALYNALYRWINWIMAYGMSSNVCWTKRRENKSFPCHYQMSRCFNRGVWERQSQEECTSQKVVRRMTLDWIWQENKAPLNKKKHWSCKSALKYDATNLYFLMECPDTSLIIYLNINILLFSPERLSISVLASSILS